MELKNAGMRFVSRVIEGMYSVQKNHAKENRLPWNDNKAQKSAQEAFQRMFEFKVDSTRTWPVGIWYSYDYGEEKFCCPSKLCNGIYKRSLIKNDPGALFAWVMDALMLGIGVGFDTVGQEKQFAYLCSNRTSIYL
jgi:hypothetical protein